MPWADALFAMDRNWWDVHYQEVQKDFLGVRYSTNPLPSSYGVKKLAHSAVKTYGNSGASCISLAINGGAKRVIMLGYDCQKTDGKAHWHGDHPARLGNAGQINKWPAKFAELAKDHQSIEIINCSRQTALDCFKRARLEEVLYE